MPTSLKAIFFDIDDTLFSTTDFADRARRGAVDAGPGAGLEAGVTCTRSSGPSSPSRR